MSKVCFCGYERDDDDFERFHRSGLGHFVRTRCKQCPQIKPFAPKLAIKQNPNLSMTIIAEDFKKGKSK